MKTPNPKHASGQRGQVLLIAVILIVLMLLGIFIFFDVHNVIRAKMKLETAEQSAALAAARWQGETLNLIGEINLIMATESLINSDDYLHAPQLTSATEEEKKELAFKNAAARVKTLSEMQTRISFIGPLIGLAAAQQAAKNNGIAVPKTVNSPRSDFAQYIQQIIEERSGLSARTRQEKVNGYYWEESYLNILSTIVGNGISVRPSARIRGDLQNIQLLDRRWYHEELEAFLKAIVYCAKGYNNWCNYRLRRILKTDYNFTGDWFRPGFEIISFPNQSEIYSADVYLLNSTDRELNYEELSNYLTSHGVTPLSITDSTPHDGIHDPNLVETPVWYGYEDRWYGDSGAYTGPATSGDSPWRAGEYLQGDLKDSVVHGGAAAYAECYVSVGAVTEFRASGTTGVAGLKDPVRTKNMTSTRVGGNYSDDHAYSGVVAKPLGSLADGVPMTLPLILPVFRQTAIIPSTMQEYRVFTPTNLVLDQFLQWLSELSEADFNNSEVNAPDTTTQYALEALRILAREDFRKSGYNKDFAGLASISPLEFFSDNYKYPNSLNGAGWLQQACIRNYPTAAYDLPPDAKTGKIYYYDKAIAEELNAAEALKKQNKQQKIKNYCIPPADETWGMNGQRYYVIKKGKILDNENDPEHGCGYYSGSPGGGHSGSNSGPSRL